MFSCRAANRTEHATISLATESDVLIVGAGPAGTATAILLRRAGWRVVLVEKSMYPRQKVCGECLTAGGLSLLDELGVGAAVRAHASPDLSRVGWMGSAASLTADLPACQQGVHRYGRAIGRDHLDKVLIDHAQELGVILRQPAEVRRVQGRPGNFECEIQESEKLRARSPIHTRLHRAAVVIDAHGSWDAGPSVGSYGARAPHRGSDLFGFKASFVGAALPAGVLPVLAFSGGYGGMVVAEGGRVTVAGCIRRETLRVLRVRSRGTSAGIAFEGHLRTSCPGVQESLEGARRIGSWLTVGPLRLGIRVGEARGLFRVGNAAGETHPLIGEGISMALESAFLLTTQLLPHTAVKVPSIGWTQIHKAYQRAWRTVFAPRMRVAAAYAHMTMQPTLHSPTQAVLRRWPGLLTYAAQLAGKSRPLNQATSRKGRT
jgi:2-polyprenyl-6-methoxyphenol hydroxylase-like FAD-dependent oxidoreductase